MPPADPDRRGSAPPIRLKRVYEAPRPEDGLRVLVDRLWPRGLRREDAAVDLRAPGLAPSPGLRRWFGHDPARFAEFRRRYRDELAPRGGELEELLDRAGERPLTLLFAARDVEHNHAVVLGEALGDLSGRAVSPA